MIQRITPRSFKAYGSIIDHPLKDDYRGKKNLFRIVLCEKKRCGWRIAYLVVRDKEIACLEQHPGTFESFEPVQGRSLLYLATSRDPLKITCFYLDKPVILKKNIWHGLVVVGQKAEIKITENAWVKTVHWKLGFKLSRRPK